MDSHWEAKLRVTYCAYCGQPTLVMREDGKWVCGEHPDDEGPVRYHWATGLEIDDAPRTPQAESHPED
jgi:hypothetical protein